MNEAILKRQIKNWTWFFIVGITLSGITAFPIESELYWLHEHSSSFPPALSEWIDRVYKTVRQTNESFAFLAYGTDWLAFAHLIIAMLFIGVLKEPVKNKWIIDWAIACCLLSFPFAFIFGHIRQIPLFHRFIDCSFGAIGIILLLVMRRKIKMLERFSPQH